MLIPCAPFHPTVPCCLVQLGLVLDSSHTTSNGTTHPKCHGDSPGERCRSILALYLPPFCQGTHPDSVPRLSPLYDIWYDRERLWPTLAAAKGRLRYNGISWPQLLSSGTRTVASLTGARRSSKLNRDRRGGAGANGDYLREEHENPSHEPGSQETYSPNITANADFLQRRHCYLRKPTNDPADRA